MGASTSPCCIPSRDDSTAPDALGLSEVQTVETSGTKGRALAGRGDQTSAWPVCALAVGLRPDGWAMGAGIRMSREVHVRFCQHQAVFLLGFRLAKE